MKLLLLYSINTLIVVSINAAILPGTQHITKDLDRQIAELYRTRDVNDSMNAAAEYFKAPQASKQNLKTENKEHLAAAAEYFKAPDVSELRSIALILAQERLAAAAEYLKAPEFPKRLSATKVENARAAGAEYFIAPESARHNTRIDRSKAAAAKHFHASDYYPKRRKYLATHGGPMFRPTEKAHRGRFVRWG
uniref:Uncharacterized protein n=1 Tax=Bactrocera dorsalis TaxID=27457 RepID=A0A034WDM2_BACDO